jgi:molecular chaperone GrpE
MTAEDNPSPFSEPQFETQTRQEPPLAANAAPDIPPEVTSETDAQLKALEQKVAEQHDAWLRAKAETENVRRRAQEDVARAHKFGVEKFAGELLAVKDSLEAALASDKQTADDLRGGVELTLKQLVAAFEKSGLKEINPVGEKFDPHQHQAIQTIESELEPNVVAQVLQKGYLIAERVLRPATVIVSKGKASA